MAKFEHVDVLGQSIHENSYLAVARRNQLHICKIVKITSKMLRVIDVTTAVNSYSKDGYLVYPSETVILSGEDAVMYILRYAK